MGLLKKKEPEIKHITVKCPNCEKEHQIPMHQAKWRLDGTPDMSIVDMMSAFVFCECGMLVSYPPFSTCHFTKPSYQTALQEPDIVLRTLKAWEILTNYADGLYTLYAHYYHECGQFEDERMALLQAIDTIKRGGDPSAITLDASECANAKFTGTYFMSAEDRLVDLYRRTEQWDKALTTIQELRNQKYMVQPIAKFMVLDQQERWIRKQDSSVK